MRITNWGSQPVALDRISVKAWVYLNGQGTLQSAAYAYNQQVFSAAGAWLANVAQPAVSFAPLGALADCAPGREADTAVTITFSDPAGVTLPPNGGYVQTNSGSTLAGWNLTSWAALNRTNDYSSVPAGDTSAAARVNLIYYGLYLDGALQCEWTSATTQDPNSGQQPCGVSACGSGAATSKAIAAAEKSLEATAGFWCATLARKTCCALWLRAKTKKPSRPWRMR